METIEKPEDDMQILAPYRYALALMSVDFNKILIQKFNHWLKLSTDQCNVFYEFFTKFYHAVLLIDDIQDRAEVRRGHPVANRVFSLKATYHCANYVIFTELQKLLQSFPPNLVKKGLEIYTNYVRKLWKGQGMDIFYRDSHYCPSEAQYRAVVQQKSVAFVVLYVELMQLLSEDKRDYSGLVEHFMVYLQIRDDYLNLVSSEHTENKGFCSDISEGKFSFPLVHAINSKPNKAATLMNILKQRTEDESLKRRVLEHLKESGSFEYTVERLEELRKLILANIAKFDGNPVWEKFMDSVGLDINKCSIY